MSFISLGTDIRVQGKIVNSSWMRIVMIYSTIYRIYYTLRGSEMAALMA